MGNTIVKREIDIDFVGNKHVSGCGVHSAEKGKALGGLKKETPEKGRRKKKLEITTKTPN